MATATHNDKRLDASIAMSLRADLSAWQSVPYDLNAIIFALDKEKLLVYNNIRNVTKLNYKQGAE